MSEKSEECPLCGADKEPTFHYDAQRCDGCGWFRARDPNEPVHRFTAQERDAVLTGLRMLQGAIHNGLLGDLEEIYTNSDQHEGLSIDDIDNLCERLNQ